MRIGGVDFPEPLLNALRDGELVIFAGAGVSTGKPANLPSFKGLARQIGQKRNEVPQGEGNEDRFLGNLKDDGVEVHKIAADLLRSDEFTELHTNLLGLSASDQNLRIVTTNFDLLFERAVDKLPDLKPEIFRAPALPLGESFQGIVHVHGAITHPEDMILTDKDFGRAYLTERVGWATRFLVELFNKFTVLFIGYSHDDIIMNYLARALPAGAKKRYALTGKADSETNRWDYLGIKPIYFPQSNKEDFQSLNEAICKLAQHVQRGLLDWQSEITRIAKLPPPIDKADADIIDYALQDETTTRFFTKVATSDKWIEWLDERNHLDPLFKDGSLTQRDMELNQWLAGFMYKSADLLFELISRHKTAFNPGFWGVLVQTVREQESPDRETLSRWASLLVNSVPPNQNVRYLLLELAKKCVQMRILHLVLQIYDLLASARPRLELGLADINIVMSLEERRGYSLADIWQRLQPYLEQLAEPLLRRTATHLEHQHRLLCDWQRAHRDYCPINMWRVTIAPTPDEQTRPFRNTDSLIDIARGCLEWLAQNRQDTARHWADQHVNDDTPLLRRLAVHVISESTLDADAKITWLLEHLDLYENSAKPEIFRLARKVYPCANRERRKALIGTILAYRWPKEDDPERKGHTAYMHFNWLYWLSQADPDCSLVKQSLNEIKTKHTNFQPRDQPDRNFGVGQVRTGPQSPWGVDELLAKPAADWLPELLTYQPADRRFFGPDREGLLMFVTEAIRNKPVWGFNLADRMAATKEWNTDLWQSVLRAWSGMELKQDDLPKVLRYSDTEELHQEHARGIAEVLYRLIAKRDYQAAMIELLPQANAIATKLGNCLDQQTDSVEQTGDWLSRAINHPAGDLAMFWLHSIELWRRQQEPEPQRLNDEYRAALSNIMRNRKSSGKYGRTVLASQFHFLLTADGAWTRENLLPLFDSENEDFQPAWGGFLISGRITPDVAEIMQEPSIKAVARHTQHTNGPTRRERFIEYYTAMLVCFATYDQSARLITGLLRGSDEEVRHIFTQGIEHFLRDMNEAQQQKLWQRWFKGYWEGRLLGIPVPLDDGEIGIMLTWPFYLPSVFPEAVKLAIQMRPATPVPSQMGIVFCLQNSAPDLHRRYPEELAKLLIHIGKEGGPGDITWFGAKEEIIDPLLQSAIPEELKRKLRELIVKFDLR